MNALDLSSAAIDELAALGARFVCWRWETRNGKPTKPPINPLTGGYADITDPRTWTDLGTAMAAVERYHLDGVGFVLDAARDGIMGGDFDGCRDPATGELAPWSRGLIRGLRSYAEVSPSGTGVKVLCRVDPVPRLRANKRSMGKANGSKPPGVEVYTSGRYFCLTGQILDGVPDEIVDATPEVEKLGAWIAKGAKPELPPAFAALLARDDKLSDAWKNGTKLGGGSDATASALDFALARYLRPHLDDADLEAVLRAYPFGQLGTGKLKGKAADRRIAGILAELGARPEEKPPKQRRLQFANFADMGFTGALLNLIQGIMGEGQTWILYGDSGSGKSLIALTIAMHIALGWALCGRKVKQGFVAFLSPEGGTSIALRAHAWAKHHGVDLRAIPVRGLPYSIDLCHDDTDLEEIVAGIRELEAELGRCVLIVVDTVSRALSGGDENKPSDMGAFVVRCDKLREAFGATIMPVHHIAVGGEEPRGHRSLRNAGDVRAFVTMLADGLCQLEIKHAKDGENGEKILFRVVTEQVASDDSGEPIRGALVVHETAKPTEPGRPDDGRFTDRQVRVLQELRKQAAIRRSWDFTFREFADICLAAGVLADAANDSTRRGIARDLRTQLTNKKAITVDGKAETIRLL